MKKDYYNQLIYQLSINGINTDLACEIANLLLPKLAQYNDEQEREDRELARLTIVKKAIQATLINA